MKIIFAGEPGKAMSVALSHFEREGHEAGVLALGKDAPAKDIFAAFEEKIGKADILIVSDECFADLAAHEAWQKGAKLFLFMDGAPDLAKGAAIWHGSDLDGLISAVEEEAKVAKPKVRAALIHGGNPLGHEFLRLLAKEAGEAGYLVEPLRFSELFENGTLDRYDVFFDFTGDALGVFSEFMLRKKRGLIRFPEIDSHAPFDTAGFILSEMEKSCAGRGCPVFASVAGARFYGGETEKTGYRIHIDDDDRSVIHVSHVAGGGVKGRVFEKDGGLDFMILEEDLPEGEVNIRDILVERRVSGKVEGELISLLLQKTDNDVSEKAAAEEKKPSGSFDSYGDLGDSLYETAKTRECTEEDKIAFFTDLYERR